MSITLVKITDAVDELSLLRRDENRMEWLRYKVVSKHVLRDMRLIHLNAFKKVYLTVDKSTNTVRLPDDYYQFRLISVLQKCHDRFGKVTEKPVALTYNPYININPNTTPEDSCDNPVNKPCGCQLSTPACAELANFTAICEEVVIDPNASPPLTGMKQTVLKTCENGDIIKEVTQPTQKFKQGDLTCDYTITMNTDHDIYQCDYSVSLFCGLGEALTITFTLNGQTIVSPPLADDNAMFAYMESYGWVGDINTCNFTLTSQDTYGDTMTVTIISSGEQGLANVGRNCAVISSRFPYRLYSYTVDTDTTTLDSPEVIISDQSDQDTFFANLGFTKVSDTQYIITHTTTTYFNVVVILEGQQIPDSPPVLIQFNFIQSNCHQDIIADGYENQVFRDVLCNVPVKSCGCIVESQETLDKIFDCCGDWLQSCQIGSCNNWNGWTRFKPCCQTNTPQPYNMKGTYRLDEKNYLIYLDSVAATKVLLTYYDDGNCSGDFYIPDFCIPACKAGIAFYAAEFDEDITDQRRDLLEIGYSRRLEDLDKFYVNAIRITDLVEALKVKHYL